LIDTHCHLDLAAFEADRAAMFSRAAIAGVTGLLVPGIRPRTWPAVRALAAGHTGVRWAVGVHPQIVPELAADELHDLEQRLADEAAGAVAIGECGLDGGTADHALQERIFRSHVRVARALDLPLVIHVLRAHDVAPRVLREEGGARGVLHSYSGGAALVPVYRDLGLAFSFAGPVTYENARRPVEAARAVPPELLLAETDAPDQSPAPYKGRRCEPAFLPAVIAGLAAARGAEPAAIAELTAANARRLFATW
jgi:TatD DNase family protein